MALLPTGTYSSRAAQIKRQRDYADALRKQAMEVPKEQMIQGTSGPLGQLPSIRVQPSAWDYAAQAVKSGIAGYQGAQLDKDEAAMEQQARDQATQAMTNFPQMMQKRVGLVPSGNELIGDMPGIVQEEKPIEQYQSELTQFGSGLDPSNPYLEQTRKTVLDKALGLAGTGYKTAAATEVALRKAAQSGDPAAVQRYKFYSQLTPDQKEEFNRANYSQKSLIARDLGDRVEYVDPVTSQVVRTVAKELAPGERPEVRGEQAYATENEKQRAESEWKQKAAKPIFKVKIQADDAKIRRMDAAVDKASKQADFWSTGLPGQLLANLGGTDAANLNSTLASIKANLGFDELQAMRDASPTGGALGQVAVQEIQFLQSVYASLEQSQTAEQLKDNLEIVRQAKKESNARMKQAYADTYGEDTAPVAGNVPTAAATPAERAIISQGGTEQEIMNRLNAELGGLPKSTGKTPKSKIKIISVE